MSTTVLKEATKRVAYSWLDDVPAGEFIAPFVADGLDAALNKMYQLGGVGGLSGDPDAQTRSLFAIPPHLQGTEEAADHVARLLKGWIPDEMRTCGTALAGHATTTPGNGTSTSPSDNGRPRPGLGDLGSNREAREVAKLLEAMSTPFAAAAKPGGRWNPHDIDKILRKLVRRLGKGSPALLARLMVDYKREMAEMPVRLAEASALASAELVNPMLRSTLDIGNEVHAKLQGGYRLKHIPNTVVAEDRVYRPFKVTSARIGDAAREDVLKGDYSLNTLQVARLSPFSYGGILRDDLIDLNTAELWEIKPMRGAPQGVVQESYYRMTYNTWSVFQSAALGRTLKTPRLEGGLPWGEHLFVHRPFAVRGGTATVLPFQVYPPLQGLILYAVIRYLTPEMLEAILAAILAALVAYARKLAQGVRALGEAVARAFAKLLELLEAIAPYIVALVLAVVAAVALVFAAKALIAAAGAAAAAAATALVIAGVLVFLFPPDSEGQPEAGREDRVAAAKGRAGGRVTMSFASCSLVDIPVSLVPKLFETMAPLYQQGVAAGLNKLAKGPTIPVASPL